MSLKDIRERIDNIDSRVLKLLNERMEYALMASRHKSEVEDIEREKELLDKMEKNLGRLIDPKFCNTLYHDIIKKSKAIQKKNYKIIAFQGEHGAYSEVASRIWDDKLIPIPCEEFSDIFDGVSSGQFDYGIVPVENTLGGVVGQVNDLLINTDLFVVSAVEFPVHHCLLAVPGTDYREIRVVFSHSQALAQCRHFLARNKLERQPFYDTAGAARWLANKTPKASAVIASRLAAELYHLDIIKENIEDLESNKTRFLILAREENRQGGEKCSILFSTEHKAGTLFNVLQYFEKANLNLSRIESVPSRPGSYAFFLDFIGSNEDPKVHEVLEKVKDSTSNYRLMGFYNEREIEL